MQGRISKVLNMKPPEVLSMLEEAAGTRMYEKKKEAALKTLEKKQSKIDLEGFALPMNYVQAEKIRDSAVDDVEQVKAKIAEIDENTERTRLEILEMEKQVSNLTAEKEASMEEKASAIRRSEEGAADLKKRMEELSKSSEEYEKDYQGVLAGKSSGNQEKCLEDQLGDAKVAVGSAETELKQLKTKISHCQKELKEKRHQLLSKREERMSSKLEGKM
ncbi:hypothetical protein Q3G72_001864 [Acer saccharum]|nr:hypothetical protein Q3G72_001864 [Acer saccharum]